MVPDISLLLLALDVQFDPVMCIFRYILPGIFFHSGVIVDLSCGHGLFYGDEFKGEQQIAILKFSLSNKLRKSGPEHMIKSYYT